MDWSESQNFSKSELLKNSEKMENELIQFIAIPIETEESLKKRFGFGNEGLTHQELVDSVNKRTREKYKPREKLVPKIPLDEFAKNLFEKSLDKQKNSNYYPKIDKIYDYLTKNEYLVLYFICKIGFNNFTPFPCIEEEKWKTGIRNNYDLFTEAPKVNRKSRYNAISNLKNQTILKRKDFEDRKGIFYFLNTENSMKIFNMVEKKELNRDDLERLNQLLKKGLLNSLDPEMITKFLHYKGEKISDIRRNVFTSDVKYFHHVSEIFSPRDEAQSKSESKLPDSQSIDHYISSIEKIYDQERPDLTLRKNPLADFPQGEKINYLASNLTYWKMTMKDLDDLIDLYSLDEVFIQVLKTEEIERLGKTKIGNFFRYLETSLENEKIKCEKKAQKKLQKQVDKNKKEEVNFLKYLPLFQIFNPSISESSIKYNFNSLLNQFIDKLKDIFENNKSELIEIIPKVKDIVESPEEMESLILITRTQSEAKIIIDFIKNTNL